MHFDAVNLLLSGGEDDRVSHFATLGVTLYTPIHHRGLARLCMRVVRSYCVHLHIRALRDDELLVYVRPLGAQLVDVWVELRAAVVDLTEEPFTSTTCAAWIVDVDVVVFGIHGFFHEWLSKLHAIEYNVLPQKGHC